MNYVASAPSTTLQILGEGLAWRPARAFPSIRKVVEGERALETQSCGGAQQGNIPWFLITTLLIRLTNNAAIQLLINQLID